MKLLQRGVLIIVGILAGFGNITATAKETPAQQLAVADSLFRLKQYTQSFERYDSLLRQKQYSSAMLIKMAYIQEGLGHTGLSMYYLNLYYLASSDPLAITRLNQQATRFHLEGYDDSAISMAQALLAKFRKPVLITLTLVCLAFFGWMALLRFRLKKRPVLPFVFLLVFALTTYVFLFVGSGLAQGVIASPNTYLMTGPSAGSAVSAIVDEGHRVIILSHTDVWLKVIYRGKEVFVKERDVLPIAL